MASNSRNSPNHTKMNNVIKKAIRSIIMLSFPGMIIAAEPADTLNRTLHEVTVEAARLIRTADKDIYMVPSDLKRRASNSLMLINDIGIPSLMVNQVMKQITSYGDEIQIRINGRKTGIDELLATNPREIARIEFIDNPGLEYGGASAVLDVIVRHPDYGGSFMTDNMQGLKIGFGNYQATANINKGHSQWSANAVGELRNHIGMYREYDEKYLLPDGTAVTRAENSSRGNFDRKLIKYSLDYNYLKPDTTNIFVKINMNRLAAEGKALHGLMTSSINDITTVMHDASRAHSSQPAANFYIDQRLPRKQTLILNLKASVAHDKSRHIYSECDEATEEQFTDIDNNIHSRTFTISANTQYRKKWNVASLTAGVNYAHTYERSIHYRSAGTMTRHYTDNINAFAEYGSRFSSKLTFTAGVEARYITRHSPGDSHSVNSFQAAPRISLNWRACDASRWSISIKTSTTSPGASQLSPIIQEIDGFQIQQGNPDLHTYTTYKGKLTYKYAFQRFTFQARTSLDYSRHPIMTYYTWKDDKILQSWANDGYLTRWNIQLSPSLVIIPNAVTINANIGYRRQWSSGQGYNHVHNSLYGIGTLNGMYRNLFASFIVNIADTYLSGEKLERGENFTMAAVGFRNNLFSIGLTMFCPFSQYSSSSRLISKFATQYQTERSHSVERMLMVTLSFNTSWGRKVKTSERLIDDDIQHEAVKAASR